MKSKLIIFLNLFVWTITSIAQQPFTPGNIAVYRVGDNSAILNDDQFLANKVYIDEFTPSGTLVQSILMPVTGRKITNGAQYVDLTGMMNLSADGRYLVIPGYNVDLGDVFLADYSVGLLDYNGAIRNVTVFPNPDGGLSTAAISDNGTNLWLTDGISNLYHTTNGSSTATAIVAGGQPQGLQIADGQLYASTASIGKVGSGLPVTNGQSISFLPGIDNNNAIQFAMADLNPDVPGPDVIYATTHTNLGDGGVLQKYSLVNGSWVSNGKVGNPADHYLGITIKPGIDGVMIFATRKGANDELVGGGELVSLLDNSGYNGSLTGNPIVIRTVQSTDKSAFRGVTLVPQPTPFVGGNIAVYRVGDNSAILNNDQFTANKVYIDEFTPSGTLVQSILMPVTGQKITNGAQYVEFTGMMHLSADGRYLVVPGYNVDPGDVFLADYSVGLLDYNGAIKNVTVFPNPDGGLSTAAISDNGTNLWLTDGISNLYHTTNGSSTATAIVAGGQPQGLQIAEGQLYASTSRIGKVGSGLPVTNGQSISFLPGMDDNNAIQFAFADLNPDIPGPDVLYATTHASVGDGGVLEKYSLVNGNWVSNGKVGNTSDRYLGITIKPGVDGVMIFATRKGANDELVGGGELVSLLDNSGYNGSFTGSPNVMAAVQQTDKSAFRGVALAPSGCKMVTGLKAINITSTQATITWNSSGTGSNYEFLVDQSATAPASGLPTTNTNQLAPGLTDGEIYYAHVRNICSALNSSDWVTIKFIAKCSAPSAPNLQVNISTTGIATVSWNTVFGASSYQYYISTSPVLPAAGVAVADTIITLNNLDPNSTYYLYVRSVCSGGAVSDWSSRMFTTGCFAPRLQVTAAQNGTRASWNKMPTALKYEFAITQTAAWPAGGRYTTDTSYTTNQLIPGSVTYIHVRTICANGSVSGWSTAAFIIPGIQVYPNPAGPRLTINVLGQTNTSTSMIEIVDGTGRIVYRVKPNINTVNVDTGVWPMGIYYVIYYAGDQRYQVKVLKQH